MWRKIVRNVLIFMYLFCPKSSTIDSRKTPITRDWLVIESCPTPLWIEFLMLYRLVYIKNSFRWTKYGLKHLTLAKFATLGLLKIKVFWNESLDVIISVQDVTDKISLHESNWVLLNHAPTSAQLHPPPPSSFQPPPSSLQHPQQYLNQNIARNWAISPNLGRKLTHMVFWRCWFRIQT